MLLGCIADDFTGATDLANTLVRTGLRVVQTIGVPADPRVADDADAVVVALKSRTIPAAEAVAQSLAALAWLRAGGACQFYFKICSTFDSTDAGNIGPVADALLAALGARQQVVCPAFPQTGRTVYKGCLFVGDVPLAESAMRQHPLTPMIDSNLVRVLGRQTARKVGRIDHAVVRRGPAAVRAELQRLAGEDVAHVVVDALSDDDLVAIGAACAGQALVTAASGVALGLAQNFYDAGVARPRIDAARMPVVGGTAAVLAGSCSAATRSQVAHMAARVPAHALDPLGGDTAAALARSAIDAMAGHVAAGRPVLIYSTAEPGSVAGVQARLGTEKAAALVEDAFARIAVALVERGVRRLVVAGGETSGAVVRALGVAALAIGPQIDPGVPWTATVGRTPALALALKSGNFGAPDFFEKALALAS